jgi:hypothetical protein
VDLTLGDEPRLAGQILLHPILRRELKILAGSGRPRLPMSTSSSKNLSKPAGEMISRMLAGSWPAFQNLCH